MAERKPVALVDGALKELSSSDFLPAANIPEVTAPNIHAATSKATPVDADELGLSDSAASWGLKKLTFANLAAWVRNIALTGLSTATNAVITAADTVLSALGKLQKQISDHLAATTGAHDASAVSNTPAGGISATTVQAAINELDSEKFAKTGGDIDGNVNFTGTAQRIRFPFVGVPVGNRMLFQSSTSNESTYIGVIPNGTARAAGITFSNSSDPDNAGYGYISMSDAEMFIASGVALGTGGTGGLPGAVPLVLAGRSASMVIGDGAVVVTYGALGYGAGSGGAANQPTSKTTPVTLNKPGGMITTHAESLAAGAATTFTLNNSVIASVDVVVATISYHGGAGLNYRVTAHTGLTGQCILTLQNISGAARAEAIEIHFAVIKKANA